MIPTQRSLMILHQSNYKTKIVLWRKRIMKMYMFKHIHVLIKIDNRQSSWDLQEIYMFCVTWNLFQLSDKGNWANISGVDIWSSGEVAMSFAWFEILLLYFLPSFLVIHTIRYSGWWLKSSHLRQVCSLALLTLHRPVY